MSPDDENESPTEPSQCKDQVISLLQQMNWQQKNGDHDD